MSGIVQLGYIGIEANDLAAWEHFAVNLLGMQVGRSEAQQLTLRMDERVHRVIIQKGPREDMAFAGYECATHADLLAVVQRLRDAGLGVSEAPRELAVARAVDHLFLTQDPEGNGVELYTGPGVTDRPFKSSVLRSRFKTGDQGMGHFFMCPKKGRDPVVDFYVNLLGFRVSDYIRQELAPGIVADAAFLHCNGRHHTVGVASMPVPKQMHHLMIEVEDMSDVGYAYDRCMDAKAGFEMTPGLHPNDQMYSFYVRTPSGFAIEYGWGAIKIDDATWSVKSYDKLSSWGHRPPAAIAAALIERETP